MLTERSLSRSVAVLICELRECQSLCVCVVVAELNFTSLRARLTTSQAALLSARKVRLHGLPRLFVRVLGLHPVGRSVRVNQLVH
jgi:hypothetical protein